MQNGLVSGMENPHPEQGFPSELQSCGRRFFCLGGAPQKNAQFI
jgi:hypothetical protein